MYGNFVAINGIIGTSWIDEQQDATPKGKKKRSSSL
jgi:hypothetical protein